MKPLRPVALLLRRRADAGITYQRRERQRRETADRDVVDVPSRRTGRLVGPDAEPESHGLTSVSGAEVQRHRREVGPANHPCDERPLGLRPYPPLAGATKGRTRVTIAFLPSQNHEVPHQVVPAGAYVLRLTNEGRAPLDAHLETQRDETPSSFPSWGRQAYLDHAAAYGWDRQVAGYGAPAGPIARAGTLSAYATAQGPGVLVVGAAFDRDNLGRAARYSAAGPNPGRARPDMAAVAEESQAHPGVLAAATLSGGVTRFSGTSAAAPQITRALVAALAANPALDLADVSGLFDPLTPDAQLGTGLLAFRDQAGRPARRIRG